MFPIVSFNSINLDEANELLVAWKHKMGPICRPQFTPDVAYALFHEDTPVALTVHSQLIAEHVGGGCDHLTRANTIELSRLCASRSGLCRVALRIWREFVFPTTGKQFAMSYQDADLHTGSTYRFDGWEPVGVSSSGTDQRSELKGRKKRIWQYPPNM